MLAIELILQFLDIHGLFPQLLFLHQTILKALAHELYARFFLAIVDVTAPRHQALHLLPEVLGQD